MQEEKIFKKISELESDRMAYLEVNDKAGARRKEKQIHELENQLELLKLDKIKQDLELYKKFIHKRGLYSEFQSFMIEELRNKEVGR